MQNIITSHPTRELKSGEIVIEAYDQFYPLMDDLSLELLLYRKFLFGEHQDPVKCLYHLKKAHHLAWPEFAKTWCDWDELTFQAHVDPDNEWVCYAGPGGVGKSLRCARLGCLFFYSKPLTCRVAITSTTVDAAGARAWGYIQSLTKEAKKQWKWINLKENTQKHTYFWKGEKNMQHCMILAPVLQSSKERQERTLSTLIGIHPKDGYLFLVDEANFMPHGLFAVFENAKKGTPYFQAHAIANPIDKFDVHGIMGTPDIEKEGGWSGCDIKNRDTWRTQRGTTIYLNPYKSPAILHPDKEVREKYAYIKFPTLESLEEDSRNTSPDSIEYLSQVLGLWSTETLEQVVLTPEIISSYKCLEQPDWQPNEPRTVIGGIDPAFSTKGGDSCLVQLAEVGYTTDGRWTLAFTKRFNIVRESGTGVDPFDQVAIKTAQICTEHGVKPEYFGVEAHGTGMGFPSSLQAHWQDGFLRIDGSRSASDDVVDKDSRGNPLLAKDLYDKKIVEEYMNIRKFCSKRQIKGLPQDASEQFTLRRYVGPPEEKKIKLEDKSEYKKRLGRVPGYAAKKSPDEADVVAVVLETAIRRLGFKVESEYAIAERKKIWRLNPFYSGDVKAIEQYWQEKQIADKLANFGYNNTQEKVRPNNIKRSYSSSSRKFGGLSKYKKQEN